MIAIYINNHFNWKTKLLKENLYQDQEKTFLFPRIIESNDINEISQEADDKTHNKYSSNSFKRNLQEIDRYFQLTITLFRNLSRDKRFNFSCIMKKISFALRNF